MSKEIDNLFIDVRYAFRLLKDYQNKVLEIIYYIKDKTSFGNILGSRHGFFDPIKGTKGNNYAKLNIFQTMWGWDFLYGYIFEYYFGKIKVEGKNIKMSVFQISDDGCFISEINQAKIWRTKDFASVEKSHSYFVFNINVCVSDHSKHWISKNKVDTRGALEQFLALEDDHYIYQDSSLGEINILKRYEMQRFETLVGVDEVLLDLNRIVQEYACVKIFEI